MILVADNLTITNNIIESALSTMDPEPIKHMVARCEKAGAQAIDVNVGPLGRDAEEKMVFFINTVQNATSLPIMIDTANPVAMKAGLMTCKNKAVINGFSLEHAKLEKILPLAREFDVDIIGYLLYPNSQVPADSDERLSIAVDIFAQLQTAGIDPGRLIVDPVIAPLSWDNGKIQAREALTTILNLPEVLGYQVRTIAGVSNLTTGNGNRERKALFEQAYVSMLAYAGLDMALLNIFHSGTVNIVNACNMLMDDMVFSWERGSTL